MTLPANIKENTFREMTDSDPSGHTGLNERFLYLRTCQRLCQGDVHFESQNQTWSVAFATCVLTTASVWSQVFIAAFSRTHSEPESVACVHPRANSWVRWGQSLLKQPAPVSACRSESRLLRFQSSFCLHHGKQQVKAQMLGSLSTWETQLQLCPCLPDFCLAQPLGQ